jgi:hypothetical protein
MTTVYRKSWKRSNSLHWVERAIALDSGDMSIFDLR